MSDLTMHSRVASEQDLLAALVVMGSLSRRDSDRVAMDLAAFRLALEGDVPGTIVVAACDLASATRRIVQGALGHGWHPSPAELRLWCNAERDRRLEAGAAERRRLAAEQEAAAYRPAVDRTAEGRARVAAAYEQFCRSNAEARLAVDTRNFHRSARAPKSAGPPDT
ncbi:Uncharacterized protein MLTONO_0386 [Mesorhizobium loti]|nr:Uncharacterized protein MLTONO_0386 [Mesorhizobium loti]